MGLCKEFTQSFQAILRLPSSTTLIGFKFSAFGIFYRYFTVKLIFT
ncbi:hypothetical protein SAMN05421813_1097 [Daejeonella rubra]|uniref:Uncharacterized protein n=1 Tax=Daejeonella rubra TaxID=990371 RepID=A0A1G9RZD1_9SPHI|nr:hypothetical protein SAMN05421813_1097 [Daejeonella rubra]